MQPNSSHADDPHSGTLDNLFYAVSDAMQNLVWVAKADGTIEYLNRPWIEYTGVCFGTRSRLDLDTRRHHPSERSPEF